MLNHEQHRIEQLQYWKDVDERHYRWQVEAPYIAAEEKALVGAVEAEAGERLLEIGCGEGANLHQLRERAPGARLVGTDFSLAKAAFASRALGMPAVCSDATALPFAGESFDAVLVRDLLHHVAPDLRVAVLREALRVLQPRGRITLIEPNGRNPLVLLQAGLISAERGVLRSTARRLADELRQAGFETASIEARQPLPVSRIFCHYKYGLPALGALRPAAWLLRAFERAASVLPQPLWAYLVAQARRPA